MWVLTLATAVFEGSAYTFALSAGPVLASVHKSKRELPLPYVFSCIMAWALIGSLSFNLIMVRRKLRFSRLLTLILVGANFVFYRMAKAKSERNTFWVMCFYGLLLGMYFPCMATIKGRLLEEGIRSTALSFMRAPAYLFAVAMMLQSQSAAPSQIFTTSCMFLTAAFAGVWAVSFNKKIP